MNHTDIRNALRRARYENPQSFGESYYARVSRILNHVNRSLDYHGVESIQDESGGFVASYVNTGEAYRLTLIYDGRLDRFSIESMGDFVERKERTRASRGGWKAA